MICLICSDCNLSFNNKKSFSNHRRYGCPIIKKSDKKCKFCNNFMPKTKPSVKRLFCNISCYGNWNSINRRNENAPNFVHGKCYHLLYIRASREYKQWKRNVFIRDNFICQNCKDESNKEIQAHHKKPFAKMCHDNEIYSMDKARKFHPLWDIENGITLCKDCHKKTDSYGYS